MNVLIQADGIRLETLLYLGVFLISLVAGIWGKINAKRTADMEEKVDNEADTGGDHEDESPRHAQQTQSARPTQQVRERPAADAPSDDMRRTLDDIFMTKTLPQGHQHQPEHHVRTVDAQSRANAQPQTQAKKVTPRTAAKANTELQRTLGERKAKTAAKTAAELDSLFATAGVAHSPIADTALTFFDSDQPLLAQAKNGVIWSEILQPPVSVRY
jgi:hypothetical protein